MERRVPFDVEAERAVIGACVLAREARDISLALLTAADFYRPLHQHMFEAIRLLVEAECPVDPLSVGAMVEEHEPRAIEMLNEMANMTPSISSSHYANTVLNHAKSRALIALGAEITAAGYDRHNAAEAATHFAGVLSDHELLRRYEAAVIRGYHDDVGTIDTGESRDDAQPWIAQGVLRRGQRMMVVARAGIGKSSLLRQMAFCAESGVHPWTGQPTERHRRSLIVELEAGQWDIVDSMRMILAAVQRAVGAHSMADLPRPAILHRAGGIDLRQANGLAALEVAIQLARPELVVIGPLKYLSVARTGENYEQAALALMSILNNLLEQYRIAMVIEAHFSRGEHGAPGGSERWVDWPDVGFGIHPLDDKMERPLIAGGKGELLDVKTFRNPRDAGVWVPHAILRGADRQLPWMVPDGPYRSGTSVYAARYGGMPGELYVPFDQRTMDGEF